MSNIIKYSLAKNVKRVPKVHLYVRALSEAVAV